MPVPSDSPALERRRIAQVHLAVVGRVGDVEIGEMAARAVLNSERAGVHAEIAENRRRLRHVDAEVAHADREAVGGRAGVRRPDVHRPVALVNEPFPRCVQRPEFAREEVALPRAGGAGGAGAGAEAADVAEPARTVLGDGAGPDGVVRAESTRRRPKAVPPSRPTRRQCSSSARLPLPARSWMTCGGRLLRAAAFAGGAGSRDARANKSKSSPTTPTLNRANIRVTLTGA